MGASIDAPAAGNTAENRRSRIDRLATSAVVFAVALILLAQGISAPFVKDQEPQYAEWIQSVADGHLLFHYDYYGFQAEKPLLFFWLTGAVVRLSGGRVTEGNSRLVSLLAGAALATVVAMWAESTMGMIQGWLAYFFLLGSYGFAVRATLAQTDMLLCFFVFSL